MLLMFKHTRFRPYLALCCDFYYVYNWLLQLYICVFFSVLLKRTPPHKHRIIDLPMPPAVDYPKSKPR